MKYDKNLKGVRSGSRQTARNCEPEYLQVPDFVKTPPSQRNGGAQQQNVGRQTKVQANSKRHKHRRKKNYILYYIILCFLFAVTGISLSFTVLFNVEQITVNGNGLIEQTKLISDSKLKIGENMFRLNTKKAVKNIVDQNLTIESAVVKRQLPNTLSIEITMAKTKAELIYKKKYYSLSESDRIIGIGDAPLDKDVLRVVGIDLSKIKAGQYLTEIEAEKLDAIDKILYAIDKNKSDEIKIIDITDDMDIKLYYGDIDSYSYLIKAGGILDIEYKLQWAQNIIDQKLDSQSEKGIIDVSVDNGYYYFKHTTEIEKPQGT